MAEKVLYGQTPIGELQKSYRPLGFWINARPLLPITSLHFKTAPGSQLDMVETECLTMGHQVTYATRTGYYLIHLIIELDIHISIVIKEYTKDQI